ncbi:MAG TPA: hypothetical protein VG935_03965 [Patescibacteria group bacterium]|nr:hypothetical protein [Patescibacteria group bacterium]
MDEDQKVQDAEIVANDTEATLSQDFPGVEDVPTSSIVKDSNATGDAAVLLNLEEMIKNYIESLDKLRLEKKKIAEMLEDSFVNNPVYRENAEKAKEALKVKNTTRQQIASQPSVIALSQKVKGLNADIKERQVALSDYLLEYQRLSGANEIEDSEGQIREIINSAKLIKRTAKK